MGKGTDQCRRISQLALMRDFLVATVALKVHGRGEAMGKRIAVDVGSHETKKKPARS
jgi:hypothetical protein